VAIYIGDVHDEGAISGAGIAIDALERSEESFDSRAAAGDEGAQAWVNNFLALGETLGFAVKHLKVGTATVKMAA